MSGIVPDFFVGREQQIERVQDLLASWGTQRILLLHGPGGIGKTRLLQEIALRQKELSQKTGYPCLFTHVLDFDDLSLRLVLNLAQRLVQELGEEGFEKYLAARDDMYSRFQFTGADTDTIHNLVRRGDGLFLEGYEQLASQKRIVILADTLEAVQGTDIWRYILSMATQFKNTVLILAGRKLDEVYPELSRQMGDEIVQFEELRPFEEQDAFLFLTRTDIGTRLDRPIQEKLFLLTNGHPILMAIAIEWLRRDMPLNGTATLSLDDLRAMDEDALGQQREEFEGILVNKILDLTDVDQAILRMAHVYLRFDENILRYLLHLSEKETRALSDRLRAFPFVRPRGEGGYTLHDEMRRLVVKHSWPKVDPYRTQRMDLSRRMVTYYDDVLAHREKDFRSLQENWERAREVRVTQQGRELFRKLVEMERELSVLQVERFHYLLDTDPQQAYHFFIDAFDEATLRYRYSYRELIWSEIQPHESEYVGEPCYQIGIRGVKYLLDETRYEEAYERAQHLVETYGSQNPTWRVDCTIQMANAAARHGNTELALSHFEDAVIVVKQENLDDWVGRVESGLGWMYRLMSRWRDAEDVYRRALVHSTERGDIERMAQLLNNLGYVRHLRGDSSTGLGLCEQARKIWAELDRPRAEASALSAIGNIWSKQGNYGKAMEAYEHALRIFRDQEDWEWMATVYHQMAFTHWLQGNQLETAQLYAEESVRYCEKYGIEKEWYMALHRLGHIHMSTNQLDAARKCFEKSLGLARKMRDSYRIHDNLLGLAEIAYTDGLRDEAEAYLMQALEGIGDEYWEAPSLIGGMRHLLGDIYFDRGELDAAVKQYCEAFPLLAEEQGFTPFRLSTALQALAGRIDSLEPEVALRWCGYFSDCWQARVEDESNLTELLSFCGVQKVRANKRKVAKPHG